jgi:phage tail protein X
MLTVYLPSHTEIISGNFSKHSISVRCGASFAAEPLRKYCHRLVLFIFIIVIVLSGNARGSSLIYKNYIVRYDRGWDILCEPYVVRQGDWVLKIFRQKGEIAHKDFREFLDIFQRLNPHIHNIDMIRPGQAIDIPLHKLEHGSLPGQASGMVTIPFVTLTKVDEIITQHSEEYKVRWGDTVSALIARKYGRFGSAAYKEGIKLFKAANPQIADIDRIFAGQNVYLPDPSMREQAWYDNLYDDQGNLRQTLDTEGSERVQTEGAKTSFPMRSVPAVETPEPEGPLAEAAAVVGATLIDRGTYYVPRQGQQDFEVDLSRHPLMELESNTKLVFTQSDEVMGMNRNAVEEMWPGTHVVDYSEQASVEEIVSSIFDTIDGDQPDQSAAEAGFNDQGVRVIVRAKWIRPEKDQRKLCITPIAQKSEMTPEAFRRYLEQHDLVLKEILPGKASSGPPNDGDALRHAVRNILDLAPANQKEFVQNLTRALGFSFAPNVSITFPYAGIQVKAFANLVSAGNGHELLVDFGALYGDALEAIRKTGPRVVQISADDDYNAVVKKLLKGLELSYVENPSFMAARRPTDYNTTVTIAGVLYAGTDNKRTLLTGANLHSAITDLVGDNGVDIIVW